MATEPLDRLERLFRAASLHPAGERREFLEAACSDDPELLQQLLELLEAHDEAENDGFMGGIPTIIQNALEDVPVTDDGLIGQSIGPYEVKRHLGFGGMGDVYLGLREQPFKRYVALKVIKRGMDSREVIARFAMERQILASLEHPCIAGLLDGGITDDGRPFFAMEYVEGLPITRYSDKHKLSVDERLQLFRKVCETVAYAHQNLVLHRDLKPNNILVTTRGEIKLLDFGIAKLLNPGMSPMTMPVTRTEARRMTPEYASPEQVRGETLSTASDTYALGIILYELLTGRRPYRLKNRSSAEIVRVVTEDQPEKPSTIVRRSSNADDTTEEDVATNDQFADVRNTTADRLSRTLRGDLDNIIMTALRKEASRRYHSVNALSRDLANYVQGLPVVARPNTLDYRIKKFVGRHKAAVGAALVVVVALIGGLSVAIWKTNQARQERDRAEIALVQSQEISEFLMALFEASDPTESRGDDISALDLLDRGLARAEELSRQPTVQAQMLDLVGRVFLNLGKYDEAEPVLARSLSIRKSTLGDVHQETAASLQSLGLARYLLGDYRQAVRYLTESLDIQRELGNENRDQFAETMTYLAAANRRQGDYATAEQLYRDVLTMRTQMFGTNHESVATSHNNLAIVLRLKGDLDESERHLRQALLQWRRTLGENHPYVAAGLNSLGKTLFERGDFENAETNLRNSLTIRLNILGDDHPDVARSMSNLAVLLRRTGRNDEAENLFRQALSIQRQRLGIHPDVAENLTNYGILLQLEGRLSEAEELLREALTVQRQLFGDRHPDVAASMNALAMLLDQRERRAEAERLFVESLEIRRQKLGDDHIEVGKSLIHYGDLLRNNSDYEKAVPLYEEALVIFDAQEFEREKWMEVAYRGYAKLYEAWGRDEDAQKYRNLSPSAPLVHRDSQ